MHRVKEPQRNTLLPPYGHTKRMGISTVPATPPASLAESMLGLKIRPRIECYFENTHFIAASPALTLQIRVNAAPIQCTRMPKIERTKKSTPNQKTSGRTKKKAQILILDSTGKSKGESAHFSLQQNQRRN